MLVEQVEPAFARAASDAAAAIDLAAVTRLELADWRELVEQLERVAPTAIAPLPATLLA